MDYYYLSPFWRLSFVHSSTPYDTPLLRIRDTVTLNKNIKNGRKVYKVYLSFHTIMNYSTFGENLYA